MVSKRESFWDEIPHDADGNIVWPDVAALREKMIRAAFGAKVIGALEAIVEEQWEKADGVPPKPGHDDYTAEANRRQIFAGMTGPQREQVRKLVKDACFGTLYWILVKLEQFPQGDVQIAVEPFHADGKTYPPVAIEETELHHLYFDWIERFSDHAAE